MDKSNPPIDRSTTNIIVNFIDRPSAEKKIPREWASRRWNSSVTRGYDGSVATSDG